MKNSQCQRSLKAVYCFYLFRKTLLPHWIFVQSSAAQDGGSWLQFSIRFTVNFQIAAKNEPTQIHVIIFSWVNTAKKKTTWKKQFEMSFKTTSLRFSMDGGFVIACEDLTKYLLSQHLMENFRPNMRAFFVTNHANDKETSLEPQRTSLWKKILREMKTGSHIEVHPCASLISPKREIGTDKNSECDKLFQVESRKKIYKRFT